MSGDYIHLTGSEDVLRAGRAMAEAAESMRRAAMEITQAVDRVVATLDEHQRWAEAIGAGACAVVNRAEVERLNARSLEITQAMVNQRDRADRLERELSEWKALAAERANESSDELQEQVERLRGCMRRAGLAAFMRHGSPDDVADHLRSVIESHATAADKTEAEAEQLRKALDGSEGELATLKNAAMGMGWTGDGSVSEFYAERIDEMEKGLSGRRRDSGAQWPTG